MCEELGNQRAMDPQPLRGVPSIPSTKKGSDFSLPNVSPEYDRHIEQHEG